jgi:hypothetical protein
VESEFARDFIDRSLRMEQRDAWKTKGRGAQFARGGMPAVESFNENAIRVHFTGVTRDAKTNSLIYALDTDGAGGLFHYQVKQQKERRLFHRSSFRAVDLAKDPGHDRLAFSQVYPNGSANLQLVSRDGKDLEELTEGDSTDEAPAWDPDEKNVVVYQSAGVGRDSRGFFLGLAPYTIEKLNLSTRNVETLVSSPQYDYLAPRPVTGNRLLYIRRPYEKAGIRTYNLLTFLKDVLYFPFRLIKAVFHFLNFFSMMFSNQSLTTAGGPKRKGPDRETVLLWGRAVHVEKALQTASSDKPVSLVPDSWQLMRRSPDGSEEVLAKGVVAFDVAPDGDILYTTGTTVYLLNEAGEQQRLMKGKMIERVVALGAKA